MQETTMPQDAQKPVHRLISIYAESHLNPTNEVIHFICVPVIVFSFLGLIWALHPLAAVAVMLLSLVYYFRLSASFGVGMLLMSGAMLWVLTVLPQAQVLPWGLVPPQARQQLRRPPPAPRPPSLRPLCRPA